VGLRAKITTAAVLLLAGAGAAVAIGDSGQPQLADGTSIAYRLGGQTVTGKQWLVTPSQVMVDDGQGGVRVIDRSQVVTTPPPPPPDTTPTDPPPPPPPVDTGGRPYSSTSPFNTPVGPSPQVLPNSAQLVAGSGLPGNGLPSPISTDRAEQVNYDHPVYYPKSTDPVATITFRNSGASFRVPVPNYAIPAGASDHHICIVYDGWEYNLWNASKTGGPGNYTFTAQIGGRMLADGPGIKTPALVQQYGPSYEGGVEAKFGLRAGLITAAEMKAGQINHALFVVASGAAAGTSGGTYPGYNTPYQGTDRVRMGTRFWLAMTPAQIDATSAPAWEKTIAKAAATYGIYVGDKGGAGFSFMLESATPFNAAGVANPWDSYWPAQGVRNTGTYGYAASFTSRAIWSNLRAIAPPSQ
jgi:hypothetical protein